MKINIRNAKESEYSILTDIAIASKRYWNYPEAYYEIWKKELTISRDYIDNNIVYLAENDKRVIGFFSIVEVPNDFYVGNVFINKGFWLDHMFLLPDYLRQGIGTKMMEYVNSSCMEKGIECLYIFSDPKSKGFYDKIGARYLRESASSIEGRTIPLFEYKVV